MSHFHTRYGIFHCDSMKYVLLNNNEICHIPYENASHMGVRNLSFSSKIRIKKICFSRILLLSLALFFIVIFSNCLTIGYASFDAKKNKFKSTPSFSH